MKLVNFKAAVASSAALLLLAGGISLPAQDQAPLAVAATPDYSVAAKVFPRVYEPYKSRPVPPAVLSNAPGGPLEVRDGKLRLSMAQVVAAVVQNNLTVAAARYYLPEARTDLMRARSGASPRGVDQSTIPSGVFAGAEGGSILGSAGGGGGGASNAGGITGAATSVRVGPAGTFDPTFTATFSLDRTSSPLNTLVVAGIPHVTTNTEAASFGYTQAFPSGTSFSVSYGVQRQGSTQESLLFNPYYSPGVTASVAQQLLNGFGYKVNRALVEVAQNEQGIERQSFRQQLIASVAGAQSAYWDLISAQESVKTAEQAVSVSQQLYNNNQRAFDAGVMARLDVLNAQSQLAASQRDLIIAQTNLQYADLTLKSMLSENLDEPLASAVIETADVFPDPATDQLPSLERSVSIARKNRPEIAIAQGNIKSQQDAIPFIKNSLEPNVNVFGLVNTVGLFNVFGTSFVDVVQTKYPQWAVGLTISFPVHNRQAQADDVRTRFELRQAQDTSVRAQSQVEIDVQNALITMRQSKEQVRAAHEAVVLEQQKTDAEQKKLAAGLSTSYNVILVERDRFAAELAEVQARDIYAKAKVALDQAMGVTLDTNHIDLDDAIKGIVKAPGSIQ
jgi:outer membrane protein